MRPLDQVIKAAMTVIPKDFDAGLLVAELGILIDSTKRAAPEMQSFWWQNTMFILQHHLGPPDVPWKKEIADIFGARLDYRKYLNA